MVDSSRDKFDNLSMKQMVGRGTYCFWHDPVNMGSLCVPYFLKKMMNFDQTCRETWERGKK